MSRLCVWLGVSRSGYYAWRRREASRRALEDQRLCERITWHYTQSEGRYGSPRIHQALQSERIHVGKKRVARIMRQSGLVARCYRVVRHTPKLKHYQQAGDNHLLGRATPTRCNEIWVGDVTYLKLNGQWRYLATVMDLYSRRILGWSLAAHRKTELTIAAMRHALNRREIPEGMIFHSDRGTEYLGHDFRELLVRSKIKQSFNRPYHCTDNAFMESFYHTLKGELIRKTKYPNDQSLRSALSGYINGFYNRVRMHSGIGYLSPIQYERQSAH